MNPKKASVVKEILMGGIVPDIFIQPFRNILRILFKPSIDFVIPEACVGGRKIRTFFEKPGIQSLPKTHAIIGDFSSKISIPL
jgi:hypothetical protein